MVSLYETQIETTGFVVEATFETCRLQDESMENLSLTHKLRLPLPLRTFLFHLLECSLLPISEQSNMSRMHT